LSLFGTPQAEYAARYHENLTPSGAGMAKDFAAPGRMQQNCA
jgi:hypothetical protein